MPEVLDPFLPSPCVVEHFVELIAASPPRVHETLSRLDPEALSLVRWFRGVRSVVRPSYEDVIPRHRRSTDETVRARPVAVLQQETDRLLVLGAIGRFWPRAEPVPCTPETFCALDDPGLAKMVWRLVLTPIRTKATRLELQVRIGTSDEALARRISRLHRIARPALRRAHHHLLRELTAPIQVPPSPRELGPLQPLHS